MCFFSCGSWCEDIQYGISKIKINLPDMKLCSLREFLVCSIQTRQFATPHGLKQTNFQFNPIFDFFVLSRRKTQESRQASPSLAVATRHCHT